MEKWAQRGMATCLRSHSKPGLLAPTSLPPSAFRVFLLRLQEMGKEERGRTPLPVTCGPIFGFLSSSVCFPTENGGSEGERG